MGVKRANPDKDQFGLPLANGFTIKAIQKDKQYLYIFFDEHCHEIDRLSHKKSPIELTKNSTVGKVINGYCKDDEEFNTILQKLNNYILEYEEAKKQLQEALKEKENAEIQDKIDSAMKWYSTLENPLVWIASMVDWVTAGERTNIMISFLTLCSQVILKEPISLVGEGLGSSGKNHVVESALSLIPKPFVKYEKKPTLPSMFHRSKENPYYYNGVIVYYGDMGGLNDQDEAMETKDILKELQTDGYVNRPIVMRDGDEFAPKDLELLGNPCLAYTTAQDFKLDSQEASRSIEFKPRTDNKEIYDLFMNFTGLEGEVYEKHKLVYKTLIERIPYVVYGLREWVTGVSFKEEIDTHTKEDNRISVINPFPRTVTQYIGDSQYYKRDRPKYNNILKIIAVFNSYNRELKGNTLYVTLDDIQLFLTLFAEYRASIEHNLRPSEIEILKEIDSDPDLFDNTNISLDNYDPSDQPYVISVPSYLRKTELKYSKKTIQNAFNTFEEKGIFGGVENPNHSRTRYYSYMPDDVFSSESDIIIKEYDLKITDNDKELWEYNYDEDTVNFLCEDKATPGMDIQNQHFDVEVPIWRKKDEKYFKGEY